MAGEYELRGRAVLESLEGLHALLERAGSDHPEVASDLMLFETAVIEIVGNVVEHGRPPGEVDYVFRLTVEPDRLDGVLSDSGAPLPESRTSIMPNPWEENGRGLALARSVLDELTYRHEDGQNLWRMTRLRRGQ